MANTEFDLFLAEEVRKVKGISYPVKAGFLRSHLIKTLPRKKLHPNPYDEFCMPDVGPNYGIMARYTGDFRKIKQDKASLDFLNSPVSEPIIVEKIRPDGYMILNGHHRWGAACRADMKRMLVEIVDLTLKSDIQKMLDSSGFNRRVTLDLDEVVLRPESDPHLEKPLPFPLRKVYPERLRLGIPALFHMLNSHSYDIWLYSAGYSSLDHFRHFFRFSHVPVTGIVTGTARKGPAAAETRKELEKICESRYVSTVHIDSEKVLRTFSGSKTFEEFDLSGNPETWSAEVMDIVKEKLVEL